RAGSLLDELRVLDAEQAGQERRLVEAEFRLELAVAHRNPALIGRDLERARAERANDPLRRRLDRGLVAGVVDALDRAQRLVLLLERLRPLLVEQPQRLVLVLAHDPSPMHRA